MPPYLQIQSQLNPGNIRVNQASNSDVNILHLPMRTNPINLDPNLSEIQNEALPEHDSEIDNEAMALSPPADSKPLPRTQDDVTKFEKSKVNDVNNVMTSNSGKTVLNLSREGGCKPNIGKSGIHLETQ